MKPRKNVSCLCFLRVLRYYCGCSAPFKRRRVLFPGSELEKLGHRLPRQLYRAVALGADTDENVRIRDR